MSALQLNYKALTSACWKDLEILFGERGACGGCWCMWWRIKRKEFEKQKGLQNKRAFKQIVDANREPGFLGYHLENPVAWLAIEPRENYPALERSRILKPVDETQVWSITCFFIRKDYRRKGVSIAMLEHAKHFARTRGAKTLEGYPVAPRKDNMPDAFAWTGIERSYLSAGFKEVARRSETRPLMRFHL